VTLILPLVAPGAEGFVVLPDTLTVIPEHGFGAGDPPPLPQDPAIRKETANKKQIE